MTSFGWSRKIEGEGESEQLGYLILLGTVGQDNDVRAQEWNLRFHLRMKEKRGGEPDFGIALHI